MRPLPQSIRLSGKQGSVSPHLLRLSNDDLQRICPSPDPHKGTALYYENSSFPVFLVVPKHTARHRLKLHDPTFHKNIRQASRKLFKLERFIPRGKGRWVIFDSQNLDSQNQQGYVCLGPKVQRNSPGISTYSKHAEDSPVEHDLFQTLAAHM